MSGSTDARRRIADKRAEQQAERGRQRRRRLLLQIGIGVAVVVLAAVLVVVLLPRGSSSGSTGSQADAISSSVAGVPAATLASVGAGSTPATAPVRISGSALTADGHPEVLYVGAEYCPFCAAERWALVQSLSRFGTFSHLGLTTSSSSDVYPDTHTLTFVGSTYTSRYVTFTPREIEDRDRAPLQSLTSAQQALVEKYDVPPVAPQGASGSIPFIDIGGVYAMSGSQTDAGLLQGRDWSSIASAMRQPGSAIAKAEDGAANTITAAICKATGQQPAAVCTASGVQAAASNLRG